MQGDKKSGGYGYDQVTTLTTSDAEGRYRLCTSSPDNYEIRVVVAGVGVARIPNIAVVALNAARPLDVDLKPGVRFQANVIDTTTHEPFEKFVLWDSRDQQRAGHLRSGWQDRH